MYRLTFIIIQV